MLRGHMKVVRGGCMLRHVERGGVREGGGGPGEEGVW